MVVRLSEGDSGALIDRISSHHLIYLEHASPTQLIDVIIGAVGFRLMRRQQNRVDFGVFLLLSIL